LNWVSLWSNGDSVVLSSAAPPEYHESFSDWVVWVLKTEALMLVSPAQMPQIADQFPKLLLQLNRRKNGNWG
jgi:hypothetical protein